MERYQDAELRKTSRDAACYANSRGYDMTTDNKTTWLPTTTAWVPTTALIDFMSRHRPDEVEILRQQYQQKLLQPAQPPLAAEREKIAYKRSVVTKSLDNFDERREVALSWLRRRIDRAT